MTAQLNCEQRIKDSMEFTELHIKAMFAVAHNEIDDLDDEDSLKQEETRQLSLSLAFYKTNRRRFANSSAVQGLIKG